MHSVLCDTMTVCQVESHKDLGMLRGAASAHAQLYCSWVQLSVGPVAAVCHLGSMLHKEVQAPAAVRLEAVHTK